MIRTNSDRLFLDAFDTISFPLEDKHEDATRAMPGQPKRLSRNNLRRRKWRERHFISFDFVL